MELSAYLYEQEPQRFHAGELDGLLAHCSGCGASDITIQSGQPVIAEIHGRLNRLTHRSLTNNEVGDLLNAMYGANGTTQLLTGRDIDTNYEFRPDRLNRLRYRVNATACLIEGHPGIQLTLRTIPTDPLDLDSMGLPDEIRQAMSPEDGCIYVTGATGSGKSTLLSSIIRYIAEQPDCHRKILTYESPIEFVYDNIDAQTAVISQSEIPLHLPSFAAGVRNALRRKPRLILVGEARDAETIGAVIEAALTGHPVYTTLHTNGVAETIRRLVGSFPKEERAGRTIDIIETMRMIVWQKLVPTIDGKRTALREYLVFDQDVRDELLHCDPINITQKTREVLKERGRTMYADAKARFDEGLIDERTLELFKASHSSADHDATKPVVPEGPTD